MKDIIEFSRKLQELIDENSALKTRLMIVDEWLKLAICVKGTLPMRTNENADVEIFEQFLENTEITIGADANFRIIWKNDVPMIFNGIKAFGRIPVQLYDIDKIFNSDKVNYTHL